jgi:prepilin-type N-terminal cleavage/methylation domain-containing protein
MKNLSGMARGFTIVELLVVVGIISMLIGILLPAVSKARDGAHTTRSLANLRNLAAANAHYGADYSDRQWTCVPDDFALYAQDCSTCLPSMCSDYQSETCMPQMIAGWDSSGGLWGYWVPGPVAQCQQFPGSHSNITAYVPNEFSHANGVFGSWRLCNYKSFNSYVGGRHYDKVFWAPKDRWNLSRAEKAINSPGEFTPPSALGGQSVRPTYVFSPAAMWAPSMLSSRPECSEAGSVGRPERAGPGAFRSPAVGQAKYPELKTRMIELYWLQNRDGGEYNPSIAPASPWLFNQGYNSQPATLFFDGHVSLAGVASAQMADARVAKQNADNEMCACPAKGLWHRGTPLSDEQFGSFYSNLAYDMIVNTAYHVLTVDGILGRDFTEPN